MSNRLVALQATGMNSNNMATGGYFLLDRISTIISFSRCTISPSGYDRLS